MSKETPISDFPIHKMLGQAENIIKWLAQLEKARLKVIQYAKLLDDNNLSQSLKTSLHDLKEVEERNPFHALAQAFNPQSSTNKKPAS